MGLRELFYIIAISLLCQMFCQVNTQHCGGECKGETSIGGRILKGFTFKKMKVSNPSECHQACNENVRCQSFNYVILKDICELNNRSKDATIEELDQDPHRYYVQVKREKKPGKWIITEVQNLASVTQLTLRKYRLGLPGKTKP